VGCVVYARRVPAETTPDEKAWMDDAKIVARERDRGTAR
jgi:hypothetical protein